MAPTTASSGYLARLGPSWGCVYGQVIPDGAAARLVSDTTGGVILTATAASAIDLGCGALPASPTGSTFVTRLDGAGNCVFARSFGAPNLKVIVAPSGRLLISGAVGAAQVDFGGGVLPPTGNGSQDFVLAELDLSGNYLWGKRLGAPQVSLAVNDVVVSPAGDVYLWMKWAGVVDLGGGPITAAATDHVIASFSSAGAYRLSRRHSIAGTYKAGLDGCGAFVVVSSDYHFDPGCGTVLRARREATPPSSRFDPGATDPRS